MSASSIGQTLLWLGLAAASFAAAAVVVFAIAQVADRIASGAWVRPLGRWPVAHGEPLWWPEFERAFADYVRTGDGHGR